MSDHIYILQNKETPLMEFRCDRDADGNPVFVETGRLSDKLPFNLDQSDSCGIKKWLKSRRAPKNRAYIAELLTQYNCNDLEGYVRFTAFGSHEKTEEALQRIENWTKSH